MYDIATNTWTRSPSLRDFAVVPGFRSGGLDVWGVSLSADAVHGRIFVGGSEANRQISVFDVGTQAWAVAAVALYDGGWGSSIEYVSGGDSLYQIDGRNVANSPQGTAALTRTGCYVSFGPGCVGSLGVPGNVATSRARLGQIMVVDLTRLPKDAGVFVLGASNTTSAFGPLPFDLGVIGAPGCSLRVSTESASTITGSSGSGFATFRLPIPNLSSLLGAQVFTQGLCLDTAANVLGVTVSDAALVMVGR